MCGRYTGTTNPEELAVILALEACTYDFHPRYNIAPTQTAPVIALEEKGAVLKEMRWGLIPSWAEEASVGARFINARVETAADKPAFREAWRQRRCLVPADGFYEWERRDGRRQAWHFYLKDRSQFCFAGLWDSWVRPPDPQGDLFMDAAEPAPVENFTVLTTEPNTLLASLHDRMPVMLRPEDGEAWLNEGKAFVKPFPAEEMAGMAVGARVNNARHDAPDCLAPAG